MTSTLLKTVYKLDNLERAWRVIHENGRGSKSIDVKLELEEFSNDASHRLRSIQARLRSKSFSFGKAKGIPLPKTDEYGRKTGKFRPIVLAPVEARIVQRAVLNVLITIPALQKFIKTPYSFGGLRKEKRTSEGTLDSERKRRDSPSAVPAAINAVLHEINNGARYVASADIRSFFTRIPKSQVSSIIGEAINDDEFLSFFNKAIEVELHNLAELRDRANDFPIEDIGVAQGNSLSPMLGNIVLAEFDYRMNEGDCRCIRYIDDFIILAPTERAANARLRKATLLLGEMDMELSPEKSSIGGRPIHKGFDFLGINIAPGKIRPSEKSKARFLKAVEHAFAGSSQAFFAVRNGQSLPRSRSLVSTLKRVDGMIDGWGKHYWFCNDEELFKNLDRKIGELIRDYLGTYKDVRSKLTPDRAHGLLGVTSLASILREPFEYPTLSATGAPLTSPSTNSDHFRLT